MSAPTRYEIKAALVAALDAKPVLDGVAVSHGWPGKHLAREHVWLGRTAGEITYPFEMAGNKIRQDDYTVTVWFMASEPGGTLAEVEARAQVMWSALDDLLAAGEFSGRAEAMWTLEGGAVEGPDSELTDEGAVAFIRADVSISARYS